MGSSLIRLKQLYAAVYFKFLSATLDIFKCSGAKRKMPHLGMVSCAPDFTNGMAKLIGIWLPHPMGWGFIPTL
jgi:hypothetical protein